MADVPPWTCSSPWMLSLISDEVAAITCAQWQAYPTRFSELHLKELMAILDVEAPSYKT